MAEFKRRFYGWRVVRKPGSTRGSARFAQASRIAIWMALAMAWLAAFSPGTARGEEAQWIWWPGHAPEQAPQVACHFRKTFPVQIPQEGQVTIVADDKFELFVNGRQVGQGEFHRGMKQFDITRLLTPGRNTVAVRVENLRGGTAALAVRVLVKEPSGWKSHSTDATWRVALNPLPLWNTALYNDQAWEAPRVFGPLGDTPPWDRREEVAADEHHLSERFTISDEFAVQKVLDGEATGSLIAMTFDEFGHVLASRENGPLLLIRDSDGDGQLDQTRVYSEQVKNCQGILALNGEVYVTAQGPDGAGLYRLADRDRDGTLDEVRKLLGFEGEPGEHGAHGLALGPDGLIYIVLGNHARPTLGYDAASPHRDYYEGDLPQPRYEDPAGHAAGIRAPGGVVIRTDIQGRSVELVAGGLRNAYDLAFNAEGDLFVHDSDMESDLGSSWYRPTELLHVVPGGEYGWRSGWAKWPAHFVDRLPAVADTGRGSPTGAVAYNHHMFPTRYHDCLFLADWSEGRILAVTTSRNGASYTANTEVFLRGQPLNVTDLDVGPDGALYFCTGGRQTAGGIYRVTWKGEVPESVRKLGRGISRAVREPQPQSAWSRQRLAGLREAMGPRWESQLAAVALSDGNAAGYRIRALDLMQLFGPPPRTELLVRLSRSQSEAVRRKAAQLLGMQRGDEAGQALVQLLDDGDRAVRREACQSLARLGLTAPYEALAPLLKSDDRYEAWAARRLLERLPPEKWRDTLLDSKEHRLWIQGALALMVAHPSESHARAVVRTFQRRMKGFVSDRDFIDMLRVVQVALHRGAVDPDSLADFREALAEEFPSGHAVMNRELVRLLTYVQADSILDRYLDYLESDVPEGDRLHLALHLRYLESGWTAEQRFRLLRFLEDAQAGMTGSSLSHYVKNVTRDMVRQLSPEQTLRILRDGDQLPTAALGVLYRLPQELDAATIELLIQLDRRLAEGTSEPADRLKVGILAVLARAGGSPSQEHLRQVWEDSPERRVAAAIALAQTPSKENWEYLVRTLPVLQGEPAAEILDVLAAIDREPDDPEPIRQVILRGLMLGENGGEKAVSLLRAWTGEKAGKSAESPQEKLAAWQSWFAATYPQHPPAELPQRPEDSPWQFAQLLDYLEHHAPGEGAAERGREVFAKAQCAKCHRHGNLGDTLGPDLTAVSRRFTRREILESILFPSHVISSQYAAKILITVDGRTLSGLVTDGTDGEKIVLRPDGTKTILAEEEIEALRPSKTSSMPEGLLDTLSLEEIADLFAYLGVAPKPGLAQRPQETQRK